VSRLAGGPGLALGPRTTLWALLEAYPFLEGFLIAYHEPVRRLATPDGRNRWARVASLEEVALDDAAVVVESGGRLLAMLGDLLATEQEVLPPLAELRLTASDWAAVRELEDGIGWELIPPPPWPDR
jgi:hypothetical protein